MSAVELSPLALGIAVVAYFGKRWWDRSEDFARKRNEFLEEFLILADSTKTALMRLRRNEGEKGAIEALSKLQSKMPLFYLYSSRKLLVAAEDFVDGSLAISEYAASSEEDIPAELIDDMRSSYARFVLSVRQELFWFTPQLFLERMGKSKNQMRDWISK